ncbi:fumarylacetoacetate hydrolase family protein [Asticcacaulis sp. AC466]|uniref:fumarylacetoacetate hydrolase family protein n=1 Tax=Asticcacaulis sp. AC466 TaxID=1282362 RepID=UPI0005562587|nr:fumarylacetoacetate hydrolase family protein [Asticcacaulis sp. AC466]
MTPLFEPQPPVMILTTRGDAFPVRRVFCIGRNYAAHAIEMGSNPEREPPFFFTKWAETVVPSGSTIAYPPETQNYQFEAELVVAIGKAGRNIAAEDAASHIYGYATGLDMTRRDLQFAARDKGRPWDIGKNVEQAAPVGLIHPIADTGPLDHGAITLTLNGERKQSGDLSDMIWSVGEIIAFLSRYYRLEPGDLIYTGTPSGVGPVTPGDRIVVAIDGLSDTVIMVGAPAAD